MAEDLLRNIFRALGTIAVLAAVYFFMVKPVLDTTNDTIDRAFEGSQGITEQIQNSLEDSGVEDFDVTLDSQKEAMKLLDCIQRANQNVEKIERCNERFG